MSARPRLGTVCGGRLLLFPPAPLAKIPLAVRRRRGVHSACLTGTWQTCRSRDLGFRNGRGNGNGLSLLFGPRRPGSPSFRSPLAYRPRAQRSPKGLS
jgi:hypothetical protein